MLAGRVAVLSDDERLIKDLAKDPGARSSAEPQSHNSQTRPYTRDEPTNHCEQRPDGHE